MAFSQRPGGGGGVLPNLVTPEGVDIQIAKKRQYLAELRQQAEADRVRKSEERLGPHDRSRDRNSNVESTQPLIRAFSLDSPVRGALGGGGALPAYAERGHDFAVRLKAEFEAALQQGKKQVAQGARAQIDQSSGGKDQSAEIMNVMQRWENIFTTQVTQSLQAVSELNSHVVKLEEQLAIQDRDRQLLRDRLEQTEKANKELHDEKLEHDSSLRELLRSERESVRRLQADLSRVQTTVNELSQQHASARVTAEKDIDDVRHRQLRHTSVAGSLEERMERLEKCMEDTNSVITAMRHQEAEQSSRHSRALTQATDTMAEVISRMKQVEERLMPDVQQYIEKSNTAFWAPYRAEISTLAHKVDELRGRIDQVDDAATSLLLSAREDAAAERKAARNERAGQAADNLSRFHLVERALAEEKDARLSSEVRMRKEVEEMAKAVADSIREVDSEYSALVEAVNSRVMARVAQQDNVALVVQEALENKRAFLEEVVRAEIAARATGIDELKADMRAQESAQQRLVHDVKEEQSAQLQLLRVKVTNNERSTRNLGANVEATRRMAEQMRQEVEAELAAVPKAIAHVEDQLRSRIASQLADVQLQLSALRAITPGVGEGAFSEQQERRDLEQDKKLEALRAAIASTREEIQAVVDYGGEEKGRVLQVEAEVRVQLATLKEDMQGSVQMLQILMESVRESVQAQLASAHESVHQARLQMVKSQEGAHSESSLEKGLRETKMRVEECVKEVAAQRARFDQALGALQQTTAQACAGIVLQQQSARESEALVVRELRDELARQDQVDKDLRVMCESQLREAQLWRDKVDARIQHAHQAAGHVRDEFADELRRRDASLASMRQAQDLRWQKIDQKLTDDSAKLLMAMHTLRAAHEGLKTSTDDHFAQMLAQDEKNLTRLWSDIEANRRHCDKQCHELQSIVGEEEHARKEEEAVLQASLRTLQQELDQRRQELSDAIAAEAAARSTAETALKDALAALREDAEEGHHELSQKMSVMQEEAAGEMEAMKQEAAAAHAEHQQRSTVNSDGIAKLAQELHELDDDHQGTRALLEDVQYQMTKEGEAVAVQFKELRAGGERERLERGAAVAEVYRRMEVARHVDRLVTQVAEGAMREEMRGVRAEVAGTMAAAGEGFEVKVQRVMGQIEALMEADTRIRGEVDVLRQTADERACAQRSADRILEKAVEAVEANTVLKASLLQDKLQEAVRTLNTRLEEEAARLDGVVAAEREGRCQALAEAGAQWEEALGKEVEARASAETKAKEERNEILQIVRQELSDAIAAEADARSTAEAALKDAGAALRTDLEGADEELSKRIVELQDKLAGEMEAMRQEAAAVYAEHQQRSTVNSDGIAKLAQELHELDDDHQGTKALLEDVQYEVNQVRAGGERERLERGAAVAEVYRRMEVARHVDRLVTQVAEGAMREEMRGVRAEVAGTMAAAGEGFEVKVQRVMGQIEGMRSEEKAAVEHLRHKVEQLESTVQRDSAALHAADEAVSERLSLAMKASMEAHAQEQLEKFQASVARSDTLQAQLVALETRATERLEAVEAEHTLAVGRLDICEQQHALLRTDVDSLVQRVTATEEAGRELGGQVVAVQDEAARLDGVVTAEREERNKAVEDVRAAWEEAMAKSNEGREAAEIKGREIQEREMKEREERDSATAALVQRFERVEARGDELAGGVERLKESAAAIESKVVAMEASFNALAETGGKVLALEASAAAVDSRVAALEEGVAAVEVRVAAVEAESIKQDAIDDTKAELRQLEARLSDQISGGSASASAEASSKVEQFAQRIDELGAKMGGKVDEHTAKIAELEEGKASAAKVEADMHEVSLLRQRVVELESGAVSEEAVAQLQARVGDLRKEVDTKLAATEHEEMRTQLQGRLDELHGRVAPLEEAVAKAAERVEEQMKAMEDELARDFEGKVAKVEGNLNFRLDQMKVEVLSKKVTELSTLGNVHSEQIKTLDVKIDEQIKQLKDIVSGILEMNDEQGDR